MGDECYSHFTYEPHKPYSIASAAGFKKSRHHHRLDVEDVRHDRMAQWATRWRPRR